MVKSLLSIAKGIREQFALSNRVPIVYLTDDDISILETKAWVDNNCYGKAVGFPKNFLSISIMESI
jgi:hypothetical protein